MRSPWLSALLVTVAGVLAALHVLDADTFVALVGGVAVALPARPPGAGR